MKQEARRKDEGKEGQGKKHTRERKRYKRKDG